MNEVLLPRGGILINRARTDRYKRKGDVGYGIRYILRQRSDKAKEGDLIAWGAYGLPVWEEADGIIQAFADIQKRHTRKGWFGNYLDHEIYDFSPYEEESMKRKGTNVVKLAEKMARDIYRENHSVVWALHGTETGLHVHFIVNTVNFMDGNKRHENKIRTRQREKRFQAIVERELQKPVDPEGLFKTWDEGPIAATAEELEKMLP